MRKDLIIIAIVGLFVPTVVCADVELIAFRIGQDGTVTDIETSLTAQARALSTPIVEADGSLTDPEDDEEELELFEPEVEEPAVPLMKSAPTRGETEPDCTGLGGTWVDYGTTRTCCKDGKPLKADASGFEAYDLVPQCG